jgi:hypothetical protein
MYKLICYMYPDDRQGLLDLLVDCGYSYNARYNRAIAVFVTAMFQLPTMIANQPLNLHKVSKTPPNKIILDLPNALEAVPEHFGLDDWGQLLTNIAKRNIVGDPYPVLPVNTPAVVTRKPQDIQGMRQYRLKISDAYNPNTLILPPEHYYDNRPEGAEWLTGPLDIPSTHWYITDLPRTFRTIYLKPEQVNALITLATHFKIVPPTLKRSEAILVRTVLEAITHNLIKAKE